MMSSAKSPEGDDPAHDSAALLRVLRAAGDGDAALGIDRAASGLLAAATERKRALDEIAATMPQRREKARVAHEREVARIRAAYAEATASARGALERESEAATSEFGAREFELREQLESDLDKLQTFTDDEKSRLTRKLEESVLMAEAWREAGEEAERARTREFSDRVTKMVAEAKELDSTARTFIAGSGLRAPKHGDLSTEQSGKPAEAEMTERLANARELLKVILKARASRLLSGIAPFAIGGAIVIGAGVIGAVTTLFDERTWLDMATRYAGGAFAFVLVVIVLLRVSAKRVLRRSWTPFQAELAAFEDARARAEAESAGRRGETLQRLREREAAEEAQAHANLDGPIAELPKALARRTQRLHEKCRAAIDAATVARDVRRSDAKSAFDRDTLLAREAMDAAERAELDRYAGERRGMDAEEDRLRGDAKRAWVAKATECRDLLCFAEAHDRALHPAWSAMPADAPLPAARAPWMRFGTMTLAPADTKAIPEGLPADADMRVEMPAAIAIPAAIGFPSRGSLVIETTSQTRAHALAAVQSLVARILTSIPPSKARFTFLDPVGLGESFAAFMHLGDEFEQLVGERIWTEPRAIEQRLVDISEHMETVIQKYLRNEFEDIDAYNDAAGEIAEPYRFLVCADFPAAFSAQSAARMVSILRAGRRCGVHVILLRDPKSPLPEGMRADDIAGACTVLRASERDAGVFHVVGSTLSRLPVTLDTPPSDERLIPLLGRIGRAAKTAARVEVPFDAIAPKTTDTADAFWSLSSAGGLRVPIGRAGATRLQQFALGEGTSQHALIAGKTGSGKSTLLHAIITGLATWYSPDEVELWLVDFKKGVEFKTYAEHGLPHARAVAIESDREFGLSVLEGLDTELSRRGELFRAAGVQDIASFRKARPSERMPRVLLVIDEFQEFFLDDDRVAQGASMLLDRLVRQGRAFGMHALLGSQTLGGAYSLARSTMGQMGVRIALQCSEADSQLILSDENLAARLLSRPGEAIYNDAGGRLEGNSPFQVAYLPDEKRDTWLDAAANRARGRFDDLPRIVFEGDARASMALHPARKPSLKPDPRGSVRVWLGEAVAIKDPTCARLSRAAGANVAVISPRDDQAVSTSAAMLLSIAREAPGCIIDVFDGTPADAPEHGTLERIAREHGVDARFTPYREIESKLLEIATDVTARGNESGGQRRFLLVHQLQRYRALRRNEDDFSFGASDAPPSPDKMLAGLVREGPVAGVHVLVTCDTLSSLQRGFDRNALREFDWKVLFQMSPADSSALIDSPAASRLGTNRGLLHSEELGMLEKFRPYALTS